MRRRLPRTRLVRATSVAGRSGGAGVGRGRFREPRWKTMGTGGPWGVRTATFDVLLLLAITIVATEAIKYLVDRPRPCDALANVNTLAGYRCSAEFDPAFPSGHASRAFAVAAFLTIRFRWRLGIPAGAFAVLAGISRVYLGLHWPSDVLGGAAVGIGFALLIEVVSRRVEPYQRIRARIVEAIPHLSRRSRGT